MPDKPSLERLGLSAIPNAMDQPPIRLFIKPYCGWCRQASDWLDARGVRYETHDVLSDPQAWEEMVRLSGGTVAPVIEVGGKVLADFGATELADWWRQFDGRGAS